MYFNFSRFNFFVAKYLQNFSRNNGVFPVFSDIFNETLTFQNASDGNTILFQMFAACSCDTLIIFIFCFGGDVIIDAQDISDDIYQLPWYQFDANAKHIVRIMMRRAELPFIFFTAYKQINFSLDTFTSVRAYSKHSFLLVFFC